MFDCSNLTAKEYELMVGWWFEESRRLPINRWNVFQPAKRWLYYEDWRERAIRKYDKMLRNSGVEVGWL